MEVTDAQYARIAPLRPTPRGSLQIPPRQARNALRDVAQAGCTWRGVPAEFGNWHTIDVRIHRWATRGVLARVFAELPREPMAGRDLDVRSLDRTIIQLHADGSEARQNGGAKRLGDRAAGGRPSSMCWSPTRAPAWASRARPARRATRRGGARCWAAWGRRRATRRC